MEMENEKLSYNVIDVICRTGKKLKGSKMTRRALDSVKIDTKKIEEYFGISEIQAALFCIVFKQSYDNDHSVGLSAISDYLGLSTSSALSYCRELECLEEMYLFDSNYSSRNGYYSGRQEGLKSEYSIPPFVSKALIKNQRIKFPASKKGPDKSIHNLMRFVEYRFFDVSPENRIPQHRIISDFLDMEEEYTSLSAVKKLKEILPDEFNRILLYYCCYNSTNDENNTNLLSALFDLYDDDSDVRTVTEMFKGNKHILQKLKFVELEKGEDLKKPIIKMTEKGLRTILGEQADLYIETISEKDLIVPTKITAKELFYSGETGEQISLLKSSLEKKKFRELQNRLSKEKMNKGLCALFYGYPGTGKTESVYQIAKATKRKIYHVDISQSKSCWFGESEKIIKEIFDKYEKFCENCREKRENIPILLFNEADAIFAKRKDSNSSNVAQTENAIQNIILEQMENMKGIMIATTNLEDNFDSAFERRFLFKIKFEKPTVENRAKIWQNKIASLSETEALHLAENYDFSGGEIDNIVRKSLMQNIISGEERNLANIEELCKTEKLHADSSRTIGFRG